MAAQILWTPGMFGGSLCRKTSMPIQFLVLGVGVFGFLWEGAGGEVPTLFLWARGFFSFKAVERGYTKQGHCVRLCKVVQSAEVAQNCRRNGLAERKVLA